jgi:hypothetical protein
MAQRYLPNKVLVPLNADGTLPQRISVPVQRPAPAAAAPAYYPPGVVVPAQPVAPTRYAVFTTPGPPGPGDPRGPFLAPQAELATWNGQQWVIGAPQYYLPNGAPAGYAVAANRPPKPAAPRIVQGPPQLVADHYNPPYRLPAAMQPRIFRGPPPAGELPALHPRNAQEERFMLDAAMRQSAALARDPRFRPVSACLDLIPVLPTDFINWQAF